ncbi:MAG: hypothetical protein ACFFBP_09215 [Promethearchaeota archaeon]
MGEDDYHSVDDSIEIEEPKIMEKKPPNDKIIAHYLVSKMEKK